MRKLLITLVATYPLLATSAPLDWSLQMEHFDKIYKQPQSCITGETSEMECSNFRGRALKRFQNEWATNAYWKNGKILDNPAANKRVNSEVFN